MSREQVIEKVRKCLELAKSDNEHEAFSAMQFARKLLAKHNLEMSDVEIEIENNSDEVINECVFETKKKGILIIANVVAENFKCKSYYINGSPMRIQFVGKEFDLQIAKEVFTTALISAKKLCKKTIDNMKKNKENTRGAEQDYYIGFSKGLKEALKELEEENESYALALQTPVVVLDYMKELNLRKGKSVKVNGSRAYSEGYNDGKTFNVKKIE